MNERNKSIEFLGSALEDLRSFSPATRSEIGYQLDRVQQGKAPFTWRPVDESSGGGIREVRFTEADGSTRVVYLSETADTLYVLRCF